MAGSGFSLISVLMDGVFAEDAHGRSPVVRRKNAPREQPRAHFGFAIDAMNS